MAEVSGIVRKEVHKLSAFMTLWVHPHHIVPAADTRALCPCPDEIRTAVWSSSAGVLTCQYSCAADRMWTTDRTLNKQTLLLSPQTRGYCTLALGKHLRIRLGLNGLRAYSWRKDDKTSAPLYRSRTAYYDILKVSPNATQAQIKSAYYKQSFIYHPDRNRSEDAARLFALVSEAYSVLGSSSLRRRYDRGVLNQTEVESAGRPSAGKPRRAPNASKNNVHFDFDAFYQAHYGEQLEREKIMRYRREQVKQRQKEEERKWNQEKFTGFAVAFLLFLGGVILNSLKS